MDFIKKAVSSAGSGNQSNNQQEQQQQQQPQGGDNQNQQSGQQKDYGDKAFDFISKKAGLNLNPDQEEKITDGARTAYEKYSGKKVDPKYSN
ncbi:hypothetical protein QQS21_008656 [Conoideocrella luteorostrata]|uniref:Uncharacterized protein n=1 Tax=Conoideocrella luteorostrata TaxID=1105319 RepID=A0AAJ0FR80_9HYPO|nr:hypothetical protein QQS21_008656 [Conoideocrella luteorostrata]